MKTEPSVSPLTFSGSNLAAARNDAPALADPGPQLLAARLAYATEQNLATSRWPDQFAALFGTPRALALCTVFTLGLTTFTTLELTTQLRDLTALLDLAGQVWEVAT